jgi:hypothetical protein
MSTSNQFVVMIVINYIELRAEHYLDIIYSTSIINSL